MDLWIRTDEAEDVAGSIRHALRCLEFAAVDDQSWKWYALALHSALQGACICHLITTAPPVGAVTERNQTEWLTYFEESRENPASRAPKTHLMNLPELLKAIRKPNSAGDRSNKNGVRLQDHELEWLIRFHDQIRNQFVHFSPVGWSIEVSGLPHLSKLVERLILEIVRMGWAFRHQNTDWLEAFHASLHQLGLNYGK